MKINVLQRFLYLYGIAKKKKRRSCAFVCQAQKSLNLDLKAVTVPKP